MIEFQDKISSFLYNYDDPGVIALVEEFEVAVSTFHRWEHGVTRPHPLIQSQILKWIEEFSLSNAPIEVYHPDCIYL